MGTTTLIQSTAGQLLTYIETIGGLPALNLTTDDVLVDIKKSTDLAFANLPLTATINAEVSFGAGADGVVTVSVPGSIGNTYTVTVVVPGAGTSPLTVSVLGTDITVTLSVNAGVLVDEDNTAILVAQAIDSYVADAYATYSGTGATAITAAFTDSLIGGIDGDFTDLGSGFYQIALSTSATNTLGTLYVRVTGPGIRPSLETAYITTSVVATPPTIVAPDVTVLTGSVVDPEGSPRTNVPIQARVLNFPVILAGVGVTTELIVVRTDTNGQFTLSLLTGSQVSISIPAINYQRTITVPSTSQNLFLIP